MMAPGLSPSRDPKISERPSRLRDRPFNHAASSIENRAVALVKQVCAIAGDMNFASEIQAQLIESGVSAAVLNHDDAALFDWLVATFSYQGVSDSVARSYLESGGGVTEREVTKGLARGKCPKLRSFWTFDSCRFRKFSWACGELSTPVGFQASGAE